LAEVDLGDRTLGITELKPDLDMLYHDFVKAFSQICISILEQEVLSPRLEWYIADLIDGRVLRRVLRNMDSLRLHQDVVTRIEAMIRRLHEYSGIDLSSHISGISVESGSPEPVLSPDHQKRSVLPFRHPVLDELLEDVEVIAVDSPALESKNGVFKDLTHWHNSKRSVDPKRKPLKKFGFFAHKRNQKHMADTIAYAASLTNSAGKGITPEVIVTSQPVAQKTEKPWSHKPK